MNPSYVRALETKANWLKWIGMGENLEAPIDVTNAYEMVLQTPDTHFMNSKFCSLVDHARRTVPDDLKFDVTWTHSSSGWLWLEEPFTCPSFVVEKNYIKSLNLSQETESRVLGKVLNIDVKISAIGWLPIAKTHILPDGRRYGEYTGKEITGTAFLLFSEHPVGFSAWSYFTLSNGDRVIDRIRSFEEGAKKTGGAYPKDRVMEETHEIRWIYTAFYLMSQKLAVEVPVKPDRAQRRRAEREGRRPESIKVISLRRLEADKKETESQPHPVDWKWQWEVRGHWRNQYYPATKEHHPVFVEAFIKGPEDKPLKDPGKKIFAAVR
jgi:hypothetical protein